MAHVSPQSPSTPQEGAAPPQGADLKRLAGLGGALAIYLYWFSYVRARAFYGYSGSKRLWRFNSGTRRTLQAASTHCLCRSLYLP